MYLGLKSSTALYILIGMCAFIVLVYLIYLVMRNFFTTSREVYMSGWEEKSLYAAEILKGNGINSQIKRKTYKKNYLSVSSLGVGDVRGETSYEYKVFVHKMDAKTAKMILKENENRINDIIKTV